MRTCWVFSSHPRSNELLFITTKCLAAEYVISTLLFIYVIVSGRIANRLLAIIRCRIIYEQSPARLPSNFISPQILRLLKNFYSFRPSLPSTTPTPPLLHVTTPKRSITKAKQRWLPSTFGWGATYFIIYLK
jgi:hypothetical protein